MSVTSHSPSFHSPVQRCVWSVGGSSAVVRGSWGKKEKAEQSICRRFLVDNCVRGATVPLSPPCIFHHTLIFFRLFSFSLPSKLPCGACWNGISQPRTQSPLVLSVLKLERVRLCVCASVVCVRSRATPPVRANMRMLRKFFSLFRNTLTSHYMWSHSPPIGGREIERALFFFFFFRKVHFRQLAAPTLQNSWDFPAKKRIVLNYSELKIQISFCFGPKQRANLPGWDL